MKIYVSHASTYDYENELYAPLSQAFRGEHEVFLPHEADNQGVYSKDVIAASDVMLAEVSFASTGQGIEIGWAHAAGVPIICLYKSGAKVSGSLRFVADQMIDYENEADMIDKIEAALAQERQ